MDFTIKINMDNAAFMDGDGRELARILRKVAERVLDGYTMGGNLFDCNGNKVGGFDFTE